MNTKFIKIALMSIAALCSNGSVMAAQNPRPYQVVTFSRLNGDNREPTLENGLIHSRQMSIVPTSNILDRNQHPDLGVSPEERIVDMTVFYSTSPANHGIPIYLTSIGPYFFDGFERLTWMSLPNTVKKIEDCAFKNCTNLERINLNPIEYIGNYAFNGCTNLKKVHTSKKLGYMGEHAFDGCSRLMYFNIPVRVINIENGTFSNCSNLNRVKIPSSVVRIGEDAFYGCRSLEKITIPPFVIEIDRNAFCYCINLGSVKLPNSIISIGPNAFLKCKNLEEFEIPGSVKNIGPWAFAFCYKVKQFTIPNSVTSIGENAFYGCDNLRILKLSRSLAESISGGHVIDFNKIKAFLGKDRLPQNMVINIVD